jgi:nucleoside-diphosphate-sugar epimerase
MEVVFHLASAHLKINMDESEYWDINVHSIPQLLEQSYSHGVKKFVHVSSAGVYGNLKTWPADEETACHPQSIYGHTKLAGEKRVCEFFEKTGFPITIIRPTWVYGPTCPRTRKLYKTLHNQTFMMIGTGNNVRHPVYILDLLESFRLVMDSEKGTGEILIIGGEQVLTTREIVKTFCKAFKLKEPFISLPISFGKLIATVVEKTFSFMNQEPPLSRRSLEFYETNNAFDISKAKQAIGYKPKLSFEEGLNDCREDLAEKL